MRIYNEVCAVCHNAGVANAPKMGDQNAWKKLIGEGQVIITAHGYVGVRAMPPRGGKESLSVEQFAQALNYMPEKSKNHTKKIEKQYQKNRKTLPEKSKKTVPAGPSWSTPTPSCAHARRPVLVPFEDVDESCEATP